MRSDLYTSNIDSDTYGDLFLEMVACGKLRIVAIGPGNEGGASFQIPPNPKGWQEAENLIVALREWVRHTKELQGINEEKP